MEPVGFAVVGLVVALLLVSVWRYRGVRGRQMSVLRELQGQRVRIGMERRRSGRVWWRLVPRLPWSDGVSYVVAPSPPRRGTKSLTVSGMRAVGQDADAVTVMPRSSHATAIFVKVRQRGTEVSVRFDGFTEREAMEVVQTLRPVETGEKSGK